MWMGQCLFLDFGGSVSVGFRGVVIRLMAAGSDGGLIARF